MLRNLLHFGDQTAGEIAVTRGDIIAVPSDIRFDALVQAFADAGHSRLPVYGESLDEVIGMVHIKDVFIANVDRSRDRSLRINRYTRWASASDPLRGYPARLRPRARKHPDRAFR